MRHIFPRPTLLALCLLSAPTLAQEDVSGSIGIGGGPGGINMQINIKDNTKGGGQKQTEVQTRAHEEFSSSKPGEAFKIAYDSTEYGKTSFRVLAPEGLSVQVTDGDWPVARDTIPLSFDAQRGKFYRFVVFARDGAVVFDKKLEAKDGMLGSLWVSPSAPPPPQGNVTVVVQAAPPPPAPEAAPPAPAAPSCLPSGELESIKKEIEDASFSDQKNAVLETAIGSRGVCGAQVIDLLGLFSFSADKLKALRLMQPHIVDRQNNYKILGAFTFDGDKKQAKTILGN